MTISVRTRRDVVVVDPAKFLAAARQAYQDLNPDATDAETAIEDVYDAAHALIERDGSLAADDRPEGLSPAGMVTEVRADLSRPLQDYGCALPNDLFAS